MYTYAMHRNLGFVDFSSIRMDRLGLRWYEWRARHACDWPYDVIGICANFLNANAMAGWIVYSCMECISAV